MQNDSLRAGTLIPHKRLCSSAGIAFSRGLPPTATPGESLICARAPPRPSVQDAQTWAPKWVSKGGGPCRPSPRPWGRLREALVFTELEIQRDVQQWESPVCPVGTWALGPSVPGHTGSQDAGE